MQDDEVRSLAEAAALAPEQVAAITRRAEGNPFFAGELLRFVASEGGTDVPIGVREVVRRRIDRLGPDVVEVLTFASVVGREFDVQLFADDPDAALGRAADAGLVLEADIGRWRFTHDLVRETLYDDLRPTVRARLHGSVANRIEELHAGDHAWIPALALHYVSAADTVPAVRYSLAAAEQAAAQHAHEEVVRHCTAALAWLDKDDAHARCDVLTLQGKALAASGRDSGAQAVLLEAAELAGDDAARLTRALVPIGRSYAAVFMTEFSIPVALLRRALELAGDDAELRAQLLGKLALNLPWGSPEALALAEEAYHAAMAVGDDATAVDTAAYCWRAGPIEGRVVEGRRGLERLASLAEHTSDLRAAALAWHYIEALRLTEGDRAGADAAHRDSLDVAEQAHDWTALNTLWIGAVKFSVLEGNFAAVAEALESMPRSGHTGLAVTRFYVRSALLRARGDATRFVERARGVVDANPAVAPYRCTLAALLADAGDFTAASAEIDQVLELGTDAVGASIFAEAELCSLAEAAGMIGHAECAREVIAALAPLAGRCVSLPGVAITPGAVDLYLGICAATLGDVEQAEAYYAAALALNERVRAPHYVARTKYWLARLRGDAALAREARALAEELGVPVLAAQAAALIEAPAAATTPFVGRERELRELTAALDAARSGRGSIALIGGEPGIGKTRLASELADLAADRGLPTVWGRCPEGGAPPYWPWTQILRTLGIAGDEVAPLLGSVAETTADPATRFHSLDAAARALVGAGPAVLVIDDAQWADPASLEVLVHLGAAVADSGLLVVVAYRDVEVVKGHPLSDVIAGLVRTPRAARVELRGLGDEEVAALAGESGLAEADIDAIVRRSDGNPFFVEELVRLAEAGGAVAVPGGVREVIRQRVDRVGPGADDVLTAAAVLGRDVDVAVLDDVVGEPAEPVLLRAQAAGLIVEDPERFGWWRFTHDLVRETLYDDLGTTSRVRLHARVATALERLRADDPAWLAQLAHHSVAAAPAGDARRAVQWTSAAAADAAARYAHEDAARLYRAALEWLARAGDAGPFERCDLLIGLGAAESAGGHARRAQPVLLEAAELAGDDGPRLARALTLVGRSFLAVLNVYRVPIPLLERAVSVIDDRALRADLMVRLGMHLAADRRENRSIFVEAEALARASGDHEITSYALIMSLWYAPRAERVARMKEVVAEVRALHARPRRRDERGLAAEALWYADAVRYFDDLLHGDVDAAVRAAEACRRESRTLGLALWREVWGNAIGVTLVMQGRWQSLQALLDEMTPLGGGAATVPLEIAFHRDMGEPAWGVGLLRLYMEAEPTFAGPLLALVALLGFEAGDLATARADYEAVLARGIDALDAAGIGDLGLCWMAELASLFDDAHTAEAVYRELRPFEALHPGGFYSSFPCPGAADLYLGMCAATAGRADDAERHYAAALALNERMDARPYLARTKYWWARLRSDAGLAGEAQALAEELGMPLLAEQAAALVSPPPEVAPFVGRERELAELTEAIRSGRGGLVLVAGEPGIGKTRLVREAVERAGVSPWWGRCPDAEGAPPYWPWAQAFRNAESLPDALAPLMGEADTALEDAGARFRLFDAAARFLADLPPTVIVLDDLQWADAASMKLLRHLAPDLAATKVVVIGTYRDSVSIDASPARHIKLAGLGAAEIAALAGAGAVERAGGNPFFAIELARWADAEASVPIGVREAIRRRAARLGGEVESVLAAAAVVGREFEVDVLTAVSGEGAEAALVRAAGEALVAETGVGRWRFVHDLVRETFHDDLRPTDRARLHAQVASALEASAPDRVGAIAHHVIEAASVVEPDRMVNAALSAARQVAAQHGHEEAARLYGVAREWLPRSSLAGGDLEYEVLTGLGRATLLLTLADESRAAFLAAADLAEASGDDVAAAEALLAIGWERYLGDDKGPPTDRLASLTRRVAASRPDLEARLLVRLASVSDDIDAAHAALDAARRSGDPTAIVFAISNLLVDWPMAVAAANRQALFDELDAAAAQVGTRDVAFIAEAIRCRLLIERGDMLASHRMYPALEALGREVGAPASGTFDRTQALWATAAGRFDEAEQLIEAPLTGPPETMEWVLPVYVGQLTVLRWLQGRGDEMEQLLESLIGTVDAEPAVAALALLHAEAARFDDAARVVDSLGDEVIDGFGTEVFGVGLLGLGALAQVATLTHDRDLARRVADQLQGLEGATLTVGMPPLIGMGAADSLLGGLASVLGDTEAAERHFERAATVARQMPPFLALNDCLWAEAHLAGGDPVAAAKRATPAKREADRLGMAGIAARAQAVIDAVERPANPEPGTVTLVFTDIESSTEMTVRMGDKAWAEALADHSAMLRRLAGQHGGRVVKALGDGYMLAFGSARRALDCVVAVQAVIAAGPVRIRVGVHTGEVVTVGGDYIGHHVNLTARIAAAADPGQVLVSAIVRDITASAGDLRFGPPRRVTLKGIADPVAVHRFVWGDEDTEPAPAIPVADAEMVGRQDEVRKLAALLDRALGGNGGLAVIVGEPGIGKTRLAIEVARRAAGPRR